VKEKFASVVEVGCRYMDIPHSLGPTKGYSKEENKRKSDSKQIIDMAIRRRTYKIKRSSLNYNSKHNITSSKLFIFFIF